MARLELRLKTGANTFKLQPHVWARRVFRPTIAVSPNRRFASELPSPQQRDGSVLQSDFVDGAGTFPLVDAGENHVGGRLRL